MVTRGQDRPADSLERLARISHHFLSKPEADPDAGPSDQSTQREAAAGPSGLLVEEARIASPDAVRNLVTACLAHYRGLSKILDWGLPCEGAPMLALDNENRPLLVVVGADDAQRALLAGLSAFDEVERSRPWLERLYPELSAAAVDRSLRLLMVVRELPPGATYLATRCRSIAFWTFRVLRMNGKTGVMIDMHEAPSTDTVDKPKRFDGEDLSIGSPSESARGEVPADVLSDPE